MWNEFSVSSVSRPSCTRSVCLLSVYGLWSEYAAVYKRKEFSFTRNPLCTNALHPIFGGNIFRLGVPALRHLISLRIYHPSPRSQAVHLWKGISFCPKPACTEASEQIKDGMFFRSPACFQKHMSGQSRIRIFPFAVSPGSGKNFSLFRNACTPYGSMAFSLERFFGQGTLAFHTRSSSEPSIWFHDSWFPQKWKVFPNP